MNRTDELRNHGAVSRTHLPGSARETLSATIGRDPWEGVEELRQAGERKARAEGQAYQLEAETKIVLARLMNELAVVHMKEKLAENKLERMARADDRYRDHIRAVAKAVEERERATSAYYAIKSELEWDAHAAYHLNALAKLER